MGAAEEDEARQSASGAASCRKGCEVLTSATLTRFAPAPTGFLHLGHVLNAYCVWDFARRSGASVLLRIEDHDRERCKPEYEAAILDDLDWLGFAPDIFPTHAFRAGPCDGRQSDRRHIYQTAAQELAARGLLYGCSCSRREIAAAGAGSKDPPAFETASIPASVNDELRYPGTCRDRGLALDDDVTWRLGIEPGTETFDDLILGPHAQDPAVQCGDVAIRDRKGNWTYQFVAAVDDFRQGVDLVVRGRDLLASTGRQIRIARLLGRHTPASFAHHALIMKSPAQKLSKSDGDTGVKDLRAAGWTREQVLAAALKNEPT
jgi:glutamyl-tRNA synthetase/glutamyl-Q tRNA(Asp) synthetase